MIRNCKDCGAPCPERIGKGRPFERCANCRTPASRYHEKWYRANKTRVLEYQRERFGFRPKREYVCRKCRTVTRGFVGDDFCTACRHHEKRREARGLPPINSPRPCQGCGASFTPAERNQQRYCSVDCPAHSRKKRPSIPKHIRRKVLKRDGWHCYLCNGPIPEWVQWPAQLAGTVDHVIPWSAGGPGTLDNLRAAHWACNRRKWAKPLEIAA